MIAYRIELLRIAFALPLVASMAACSESGDEGQDDVADVTADTGGNDAGAEVDTPVDAAADSSVSTDAVTDADADTTEVADVVTDVGGDGSGDDTGDEEGRVCDGTGLSKGPWVIGATADSAVIRWEACRAGFDGRVIIEPEVEGEGSGFEVVATESEFEVTETNTSILLEEPVDWAGIWWMHQAQPTGLEVGTCYRYRLAGDETAAGRFCTARAPGEDFSFLSVGDTNPALGPFTSLLLDAVLPPTGTINPDFTLHGGDIQYYNSLLETWAFWFTRMPPLLRQGAFFAAIGNHEMETPREFEEYYLRFFEGGGFGAHPRWYSFSWGGVWFFSLDTQSEFGPDSEQGAWLTTALAEAQASEDFRFSVVFLHRPFFSCGDNDHHPEEQAAWEPTFIEREVRLVIQAHMHAYERFEKDGITYITSAGGGGGIGNVNEAIDRAECVYRVEAGEYFHAVLFEVDENGISGTTLDEDSTVQDSFFIADPLVPAEGSGL